MAEASNSLDTGSRFDKYNLNPDTRPSQKNPWWVNIMMHIWIISMLPSMIVSRSFFSILILMYFVYLGNQVQKNKIILNEISKTAIIIMIAFNIYSDIKSVKIIINWLTTFFSWVIFLIRFNLEKKYQYFMIHTRKEIYF